ncbi:DUF6376 family protein [Domibacillus indicus]|uniref:DUF6376 family protein n=1 Tax=Domibacillus indicus TaxID=1437523 RepID=UPI000617EDEE|nr:DUF6376 family protein [Domibacillus indicus]
MIKKWIATAGVSAVLLSGCSLLDEANNTLTYASEMTEFLNETQEFAAEVPALLENAASDPDMAENAQNQLQSLQQDIEEIQQIEVPAVAEGVHGTLIDYSTQLESGINDVLAKIETGQFDPEALLENTELLQTVQEIQELRTNIEQLGQ